MKDYGAACVRSRASRGSNNSRPRRASRQRAGDSVHAITQAGKAAGDAGCGVGVVAERDGLLDGALVVALIQRPPGGAQTVHHIAAARAYGWVIRADVPFQFGAFGRSVRVVSAPRPDGVGPGIGHAV
jgi:hypothetical protein